MDSFPSEITGYTPVCLCGRGAYGQVWLVVDAVGSYRALKIVSKSILGDWEREFKGLQNFQNKIKSHPNLIQVFHIEDCGSFFYYTMEVADNLGDEQNYIPSTLENWVKQWGALGVDTLVPLFDHLLDGVETLHQAGLIHRDIKPDNIVFVENVPKLSDIGLVSSISQTLSLAGTQAYVPPEFLTGEDKELKQSVDIYALGKTLYRVFSGQQPDNFPFVPHQTLQTPAGKRLNQLVKYVCHPSPKLRIDKLVMFRQLLHGQIGLSYKIKFLLYFFCKFAGNIYFATLLILVIIGILIFAIFGPMVNSFTPKAKQEHFTWTPNDEAEFIALRKTANRSHAEEIRLMQLMEKLNNVALSNDKQTYEVSEEGRVNRKHDKVYEERFDYGEWRFNSQQEPSVVGGFRFAPNQDIDMILSQALPSDFKVTIDLNIPKDNQDLEISILSEDSVVYSQRADLNKKMEKLPHCFFSFRIGSQGVFSELSYIADAVVSSSAMPHARKIQPSIEKSYIGQNQLQIIKTGYRIRIYADGRELFSHFDFPWGKNYLRLRSASGKASENILLTSFVIHNIQVTNGRGRFRLPLPRNASEEIILQKGQKQR